VQRDWATSGDVMRLLSQVTAPPGNTVLHLAIG
jgi:hypothetical protein